MSDNPNQNEGSQGQKPLEVHITELQNAVKSLTDTVSRLEKMSGSTLTPQVCQVCYNCYICHPCYICRPICYECNGCGPCSQFGGGQFGSGLR